MCWCSLNSEALSTQARSQLQSLVERLVVTVYVCVDRYVCGVLYEFGVSRTACRYTAGPNKLLITALLLPNKPQRLNISALGGTWIFNFNHHRR